MKTKLVKCISNYLFEDKLTIGEKYLVIDIVGDNYVIGYEIPVLTSKKTYAYMATVRKNHFEDIV